MADSIMSVMVTASPLTKDVALNVLAGFGYSFEVPIYGDKPASLIFAHKGGKTVTVSETGVTLYLHQSNMGVIVTLDELVYELSYYQERFKDVNLQFKPYQD